MKWFLGVIFLLLLAWVFDLGLLAYAGFALLAVLVGSRLLTQTWANNLSAVRKCDQLTAEVGDTVTVSLNVENQGALPVAWLLLEDLLPVHAMLHEPPNLRVMGRRVDLTMLWGGGKKELEYQLECNRRGYYQIGPAVLETGDLFGLHRRYRVMSEPNYLMVYPNVVPLEGFEISSKRPIGEVRMTYRLYEDPTRIAGVRRYEPGDPLNRVHWKATASTGRLHSKVYEPSTVIGATIMLDFHKQSHAAQHEPYRSELAITMAASLANSVYEMQQQIGLISNGRDAADRIRQEGWLGDARTRSEAQASAAMQIESDRLEPVIVETQRGVEQFTQILETLARLELTDGLDLPQLVTETSSRLPRDATVIAIMPTVTTEAAVALGTLRRNGYAVTAILNLFESHDFAKVAGMLIAEGIETRHLKDEQSVSTICRDFVLR